MAEKNYNREEARALPDKFDERPPQEAKELAGRMFSSEQYDYLKLRAEKVGKILANLNRQEVDLLYETMVPNARQIVWYDRRYRNMQLKIDYLSDNLKALTKQNLQLRKMVSELGGKLP